MAPIVTLADLSQFTVLRTEEGGERTLIGGRLRKPGALYLGQTVSLHVSPTENVWGDITEFDPDASTCLLSVFTQNLHPAVVLGASFPVYDSQYVDRIKYALDSTMQWTRTRFVAPDAFVQPAQTPGWKQSRVAVPGDEGRTDGQIVPGGWDHEHCEFCHGHIEPGGDDEEGFVNDDGEWVCLSCHGLYIRRHDLRFVLEGVRRDGGAPDDMFQSIMRMIEEYDLTRLRRHLDGGGVDARSRYGWTPLMVAAMRGHLSLIALLLSAGADVNAGSAEHGYTALALAAQRGNFEAVEMLLDAGASVGVPDDFWGGSLLLFVKSGEGSNDAELLERLRQAGAV